MIITDVALYKKRAPSPRVLARAPSHLPVTMPCMTLSHWSWGAVVTNRGLYTKSLGPSEGSGCNNWSAGDRVHVCAWCACAENRGVNVCVCVRVCVRVGISVFCGKVGT